MSFSSTQQRTGPLAGVRVLDLTSVVLGPLATQILGDYGADVIKVESLEGDLMRSNGVSRHLGMSSIYLSINRNKRSLAIDLKTPEGVEAIRRLIPTVDVFVHNMRVAAIERLGLGYAAVAAIKPSVVYCAATGYGEGGKEAGKPVFDDIVQAGCGLVGLMGTQQAHPDYVPSLIADKTAGMATANAVLAALFHQARTGEGQYVEVPMFETMVAFMMVEHQGGQAFEPALGPAGYARLLSGGRKPAATRDGHVAVLPYSDKHWTAIFNQAGRQDLLEKYNFTDRNERNARLKELYSDLEAVVQGMSSAECLDFCERFDIPATRIYGIDQLIDHPHLQSVDFFQRVGHPTEGATVQVRPPVLFAQTPASIDLHAPTLGEHTHEILTEAGIEAAFIAELTAKSVISAPAS